MFEYFPGNYVWNLTVVAALNSGGLIDEIDRACRPLVEIATHGSDAGTAQFLAAWQQVSSQLEGEAEQDERSDRLRGAAQKYARAANYLCQAERMLPAGEDRNDTYRHVLHLIQKTFECGDPATRRVTIPYENTTLPAYFTQAPGEGRKPTMIMWNGLDSTKEHMYCSGFQNELARRGINTLMVDCPGSGEALRLQGLTARIDSEVWAAACVDYLLTREDVQPDRIGLVGWSLGGYYAPRAAAFEDRLALVCAWGANHNWGAVQRRRLLREGENPVPHYWAHVLWVWGFDDVDSFIDFADDIHLDGIAERITCPFLITHGANDRQIPVEYAYRTYDQATNAAKRDLRVFTADEGGAEHVGLDHLPYVACYVADWIAETFAAMDAQLLPAPDGNRTGRQAS